jgi:hypothetical protein
LPAPMSQDSTRTFPYTTSPATSNIPSSCPLKEEKHFRFRKGFSLCHTALAGSGSIIKIESKGKSVIKIGNMAPDVGKFIFGPSPVVLDGVEVRRIGWLGDLCWIR